MNYNNCTVIVEPPNSSGMRPKINHIEHNNDFSNEIIDIIRGKSKLEFTVFSNVDGLKVQNAIVPLKNPRIIPLSVIFTGETAKVFLEKAKNCKTHDEVYDLAGNLFEGKACKDKTAFIADSMNKVRDITVDMKCNRLLELLFQKIDKENSKLAQIRSHNSEQDASSLFTKYKEAKIEMLSEFASNKVFSLYYLKNALEEPNRLEALKDVCRQTVFMFAYNRGLFTDALTNKKNPYNKFKDINGKVAQKEKEWEEKGERIMGLIGIETSLKEQKSKNKNFPALNF